MGKACSRLPDGWEEGEPTGGDIALRTERVFQNKGCVTCEVIDTVRESEGYYIP